MAVHEADLHNHTRASDGDLTPAELVETFAGLGVRIVAVTDHDTLDGVAEATTAGRRCGVEVIPGVEVTVRFLEPFRGSLHLLVYVPESVFVDPAFRARAAEVLALGRGEGLMRARLEEINRWFAPGGMRPRLPRALAPEDQLRQEGQITRRHFARAIGALGIDDRVEVMAMIGNDSPAYVPSGLRPEDLPAWLGAFPTVRVLAHPAAGSFPGDSHYREVLPPIETVEAVLPRFDAIGLDGLEVRYPGHTEALAARVEALRIRLGLPLATGGSDCHDRERRPPGTAGVGADVVERMRAIWAARGAA
jgi:hypothetical protein